MPFTDAILKCRCTTDQLKSLIESDEDVDPIVGLYLLSSENIRINDKDEIAKNYSKNLSSWIIKPVGDHFEICHTEFTKYQHFNSKIFKLDDGKYLYRSVLKNGQIVATEMVLTQNGLKYTYQLPDEYYLEFYNIKASDSAVQYWSFDWEQVDITQPFQALAKTLDLKIKPQKRDTELKKVRTKSLHKALTDDSEIAGHYHLDKEFLEKKLSIQEAYTSYPGVQTLVITFKGEDQKFELDITQDTYDILSIRPVNTQSIRNLSAYSKYFEKIAQSK